MKMKALSVLAGVSAPLILTGPASATFQGVTVRAKENSFGLLVCNVYAIFDNPAGDIMQAVAGTPASPLLIEVQNGTFYQNVLGTNKAPTTAQIGILASLAFDTFVTIGVKAVGDTGQPMDGLTLTPGFPAFGPSSLDITNGAWAVTPADAQSNPFDPDYVAGNGEILIGQFSTADGTGIGGIMLLQYVSDGNAEQSYISFFHVPSPGALALLGTAGLIGARRRRRR